MKLGNECPQGYKQTEVGVIPEEWEFCPVEQKGEVITGKALAVNAPGAQRPYLRTKNVFDGRIDIDDVLTMPMTDDQFAKFRIRNGDVLLNEGQSLELVGRCAMYQDEYPEPCAIQNALLRFRAHTGVSEKFASYLFRHCQQTGVFARIALQTTSVAHLGGSRFEKLRLAWPTEREQRAIAEALSDVDELLGALDRLIAKKRDIKQAAMQQLLTGQTRLPGFSGEWDVKRLGDIVEKIVGGGTPSRTNPAFWGNEIPWVTVKDFATFNPRHSQESITRLGLHSSASHLIPAGTLITSTRMALGKATVYEVDVAINQDLKALFLKPDTSVVFLTYWFEHFGDKIDELGSGSTVKGISLIELKHFPFHSPPLPEQTAIAAVLSDMDAELAALEQRREKTRLLKQGMMQELLTGRIRLL
jgi:type I restriction enzyme S subunit